MPIASNIIAGDDIIKDSSKDHDSNLHELQHIKSNLNQDILELPSLHFNYEDVHDASRGRVPSCKGAALTGPHGTATVYNISDPSKAVRGVDTDMIHSNTIAPTL